MPVRTPIMGAAGRDFHNFNVATPIDLRRIIRISKPALRVTYELQEIGRPDLQDALRSL